MTGPRVVLATHNRHKLAELRDILRPVVPDLTDDEVVSAADVGAEPPVEDGVTFAEN
ncbi:MAG: non-canonical purine NTP pyrophosphatase, partial [Actinotalea sp.]|nr:non-canonical purine NTP pyrophosphatase [Actinotalea sp.]